MKKFLSLVLALVMTMSLVTIGAGATEYKDLTDKGDIQYSEAVAVLNKLGIITGYEDGSFKPTGALTRGAAAKIIVSLMIGSEAASNLTVAAAPYKDVPVTNTFAAVISYCKTAGYISGYSDGTFRPTGALTGYAFSKMLLGALGYSSAIEGFTSSGWTMNVAKIGNVAGLFNDISGFSGNAGVDRQTACQLALNTLKATEVEYAGSSVNVTGKDINVSVGNNKATKIERQNESSTQAWNGTPDNLYQFCEEHFSDLKMLTGSHYDDFGRPANTWTFKKVTIGDFAKTADFVYTASVGDTGKDSADTALSNMGLKGYKTIPATYTLNGAGNVKSLASTDGLGLEKLTGNGTIVEIFKGDSADTISAIVVIQPQLMQVSSVSSKTVALKLVTSGQGVAAVMSDDNAFASVSGMKADDYVMVIPCKSSASASWKVFQAYAPTVVTGSLTSVYTKSSGASNAVTVAGTKYSVAAVSKDLSDLTASTVTNTKKDVTLYVDANGFATYIKDTGAASEFMIYKNFYQSLVNGKMVYYVEGYDFSGNIITVNVGSSLAVDGAKYGDVINYTTSGATGSAEYVVKHDAAPYSSNTAGWKTTTTTALTTSTSVVNGVTVASDVKTIFVSWDTDVTADAAYNKGTAVKNVTIKNGVANVTTAELANAQMYVNKDNAVKAIVVMTESSDAVSDSVLYVKQLTNSAAPNGTKTYTYTAYINGAEESITSTDLIDNGSFATYTKGDTNYTLKKVTASASATSALTFTMSKSAVNTVNNDLLTIASLNNVKDMTAAANTVALGGTSLNLSGATWIDLTDNGIASGKTLKDCTEIASSDTVAVKVILNNKPAADNQYKVAQIVLVNAKDSTSNLTAVTYAGVAQTIGVGTLPNMTFADNTVASTAVVLTPAAGSTVTSIVSATPAAATVSAASGNTFSVTPVAAGNSVITVVVTAADGVTTTSYTFTATVTA
ncbi:S-layer homology domain-containing protein [Oscillibacter sp.]|uniref:S-layer homology domain-containing protein n=1 Tax=Oscillibacter sp. TaxID=1945593 RepID=UPI00339A7994